MEIENLSLDLARWRSLGTPTTRFYNIPERQGKDESLVEGESRQKEGEELKMVQAFGPIAGPK